MLSAAQAAAVRRRAHPRAPTRFESGSEDPTAPLDVEAVAPGLVDGRVVAHP
jgi:hypothetical protein